MDPSARRRSHGVELGLGLLAALACLWLLSRPERQEARSGAARPDGVAGPVVRSEAVLDPAAFDGARAVPRGETTSPPSAEPRGASPSPEEMLAEEPAEEPAPALVVRVLDAQGLTVGRVQVLLTFLTEPESESASVLFHTDELGLARIPLTRFHAGRLEKPWFRSHVLRVNVPLREGAELDLGRAIPAPGQVTLRLPPAGALRLSVRTADDRPAPAGSTVVAEARIAGEKRFRSSGNADVRDGVAVFPCVDLDAEFRLRGLYASVGGQAGELLLAGPTYSGETVEATLRLGVEWPRLRLRAVQESREPLAMTRLDFRIDQAPRSPQKGGEFTDDVGAVELVVFGPELAEFRRDLELWILEPVPRRAMLVLPEPLGRPTDLGDVVFRPAPPGSVPPDR